MRGMRRGVRPRKDKKIFTRTAKGTKNINVKPVVMRGGIRL